MTGSDAIRGRLALLDTAIANSKSEISGLNIQLEDGATRLQAMDQVLADLRAAYAKENAKAFTWSEEAGVCGACGQTLPEHKVAEIRAEAEAEFNQAKARALESNKIQGQTKVKQRDELESKLTLTKQTLATAEGLLAAREEERTFILEELDAVSSDVPEADEALASLTAKKREIQAQIADLATGASDAVSEIDLAIRDCRGQLQDHERYRARQEEIANRTKRVEELEERENKISAEIERIDRELGLCEEFTRAKVRALTDRINSKFRITSFKLFEEQINGGLQECCEPMLEGRPYSTAMSNSERINVGLDIIRTLEEHWGFAPPIVIDNCESVSDPLPTHGQQIRLIVSKADEALRVELSPMTAQDGQEALAI